MSLKNDLTGLIKGQVLDDDQNLTLYSSDASIFKIKPAVIAYPQDTQDIETLVKFISKSKDKNLSLTPRSAGTDMSGGAINDSIILDMTKHFNRIIGFRGTTVTLEPGVYHRDFEKEAQERGLLLPCYPSSKDLCTLGGMVGNNSAGEKTLSYGQTEKYVNKLKVVLSDGCEYLFQNLNKQELDKKLAQKDFEGEIYNKVFRLITENELLIKKAEPQVSKNSSGYLLWKVYDGENFNMAKLFVGSQGTLGIVTEIEYELVKPKTNDTMLVIFLEDLDSLDKIVNRVLDFKPEAFECYDDQTLSYALKFLPELLPHFHFNSKISIYLQFLQNILDSWIGKTPKLTLIAQFADESKEEALRLCKGANDSLAEFKLKTKMIDNDKDMEKYWVVRHESFNLLRHHAIHMRSAPFIDDIIVKPEVLPRFLPELKQILEGYKDLMLYTIAGHIGNGNFHIIPLLDIKDEKVKQAIMELSRKVYELVFRYEGSMSAEHNDGLVRGPYLEKMYGEDIYQLFKEVKTIFDPNNIFNPHKKTEATFEYSTKHFSDI